MTEPTGPLPGPRAPRPHHVPLTQTTLPRYPTELPELDAAPHLVVTAGDDAAALVRDVVRGRDPGRDRHCEPDAVASELAGLVTGWRVLAAGPEHVVQAVRTAALAAGALDDEIVLVATDAVDPGATRVRLLFCGGCHRRFDARVAPGDPVACPGCRAALTVAEHHSHRHGAFLAVPSGRDAHHPNERHPRATPLPEGPPRSPTVPAPDRARGPGMSVRFDVTLRVEEATTPCPGVRSLALGRDDGVALPSFPPGSHIGVRGAGVYSLTGPGHAPRRWHVTVALRPDGTGTSRRTHALAVGDRVRATMPRSGFAPVATARHHVLVAGGIGVTPIVSHARWHAFWGHSFEVLYAHRPGVDPHVDDLRALCGDRLRTVTGRDAWHAALEPALRAAPFGSHVYTCGPPSMIDAVARAARAAHWVDGRVHAERFVADTMPGAPFRVVLRSSGRAVDVAADESLLEALERSGVDVPSLCRQGVCGECVTRVHTGRVEHRDSVLAPDERASRMALCVSRGTDLELDL